MRESFSSKLRKLRTDAGLTNNQLARLAKVPDSLISGLQNDNRRVGEYQARKIGKALNLTGDAIEAFVYAAINHCTEKVLNVAKPYPAQLLNLLALQLHRAGIAAEEIHQCAASGDELWQQIELVLNGGRSVILKTDLTVN